MIRTRVSAAVVGSLLWLLVALAPALAAGTLTVSPPSGSPGQVLTASGSHDFGVQQVTLQWDGNTSVGEGSSDQNGSFSITFAIPANATQGGHQLRACIRSNCSVTPPFTVAVTLAPSAGPSATPSAPTPSASTPAQSATPAPPASPSAGPTDAASPGPVTSESPGPSLGASGEPSPAASASGVIVGPTVAPSLVPAGPANPDTFGRLKQAWPWLLVAGGGLGLALLALYVILSRNDNRTLKSETGHTLQGHGSEKWMKDRTGDAFRKGPKLMQAAAKGTHAQPAPPAAPPPTELVVHEATHDGAGETITIHGGQTEAPPDATDIVGAGGTDPVEAEKRYGDIHHLKKTDKSPP